MGGGEGGGVGPVVAFEQVRGVRSFVDGDDEAGRVRLVARFAAAGGWGGVVRAVVVEREDHGAGAVGWGVVGAVCAVGGERGVGGAAFGSDACVVLEVELVVHGEAGGFAAKTPEDGTVFAADFVNGFDVSSGDDVVA